MGDDRGTAPHEVGDAAAFVASLRRLKEASGLTYRQLEARAARRGHALSHSTLAGALNRVSLPRAELVSAFLHACGCPDEERRAWLTLHRRLGAGGEQGVRAAAPPAPTAAGPAVPVAGPAARGTGPAAPDPSPRQPYLPVVPSQLPADCGGFTGRRAELRQILSLGPGRGATAVTIGVIDGMAGVGKTALAVHAAHRLTPAFPDGRLFVDLHGCTQGADPVDPATALESMLRALGIPDEGIPPRLDERAALYRTRLTGTRTLVVLDNAHSESQVVPLLPAAPGCLVLVTGRRRLIGLPDACHISLDVLPPAEAITLFTRRFTHPSDTGRLARVPLERLAEVAELCGRLPLALRLAAARLQARPAWTVDDLAGRLAQRQERPEQPQDARRSVPAALDLSYRHLTAEQRRTYRLLGLHPGPDLDAHAAAALTDTPVAHTVRLLDDLVDCHLLTEPAPGRYRFHDLIRLHARTTAAAEDPEADRRAAVHRLLDHYAHTASTAMDTLYPCDRARRPRGPVAGTPVLVFRSPAEAETWLDAEVENLLAAAAHAATHGRPQHTRHQSATLHHHLRARGRYGDAVSLHRRAADTDDGPPDGRDFARATGNAKAELFALIGTGHGHLVLGRHQAAARCFEKARHLWARQVTSSASAGGRMLPLARAAEHPCHG
ncbi:NB-ARC domain-containing protein [Streptomyces sp. NPDC051207]|uniref:NB-ARC domain-containing protein n=1 Tax=Streptomyces sp. NPDC051207 TaxID=3154641 RepID=UPI0034212B06